DGLVALPCLLVLLVALDLGLDIRRAEASLRFWSGRVGRGRISHPRQPTNSSAAKRGTQHSDGAGYPNLRAALNPAAAPAGQASSRRTRPARQTAAPWLGAAPRQRLARLATIVRTATSRA